MERPTPYHELGLGRLKDKVLDKLADWAMKGAMHFGCEFDSIPDNSTPDWEDQYGDTLATPVEPVTDWPPTGAQVIDLTNRWCDMGTYIDPAAPDAQIVPFPVRPPEGPSAA